MIQEFDETSIVRGLRSIAELISVSVSLGTNPNMVVSPSTFVRIAKVNGMGEHYDYDKNNLWTSYIKDGKRPISYPVNSDYKKIFAILKPITDYLPVSSASWAYVRNKGNVRFMWEVASDNPDFIWKEDLHGFFPSITKKMLYKYFVSKMDWSKSLSAIVSALVTYRGVLPQGTPTSPNLSNALSAAMHEDMLKLADKNGIHYATYSDDFYFWGNLSKEEDDSLWNEIKGDIKSIVKGHGFSINYKKVYRQRNVLFVLNSAVKNGYVIPDSSLYSLMRAVLLNMLNPDKVATIDGEEATIPAIRGKMAWLWSINNKWFIDFFGKYVEKLKRWYPYTYNDISEAFPVEFRDLYFEKKKDDMDIITA